jgi:hypothetical protein
MVRKNDISAVKCVIHTQSTYHTYSIVDLVLKLLSSGTDADQQTAIREELDAKLPILKEIAHTMKKLPISDKGTNKECPDES